MDERSDALLVEAVDRGDRAAFGVLVQRHQGVVSRRAHALLGDRDQAADAVQDAFIRAFNRIGECKDGHRFAAWICRIVQNLCMDHLRNPRSRTEGLDAIGARMEPRRSPADLAERSEAGAAINEALDALPHLLRQAFLLKHVEEMSYPEMEEATGASESALKMRVKRAREHLAAALADFNPVM
jgi:RNA polymerase sigma-70 factor, ECF subfamily